MTMTVAYDDATVERVTIAAMLQRLLADAVPHAAIVLAVHTAECCLMRGATFRMVPAGPSLEPSDVDIAPGQAGPIPYADETAKPATTKRAERNRRYREKQKASQLASRETPPSVSASVSRDATETPRDGLNNIYSNTVFLPTSLENNEENTERDNLSISSEASRETPTETVTQDARKTVTPSDDFDEWWCQYPRSVGKKPARKAYDLVIKKREATAQELLAGAIRYSTERSGQDPKFTKLPAAWLNDGRWADEPAPAGQPARGNLLAAADRLADSFRGGVAMFDEPPPGRPLRGNDATYAEMARRAAALAAEGEREKSSPWGRRHHGRNG